MELEIQMEIYCKKKFSKTTIPYISPYAMHFNEVWKSHNVMKYIVNAWMLHFIQVIMNLALYVKLFTG